MRTIKYEGKLYQPVTGAVTTYEPKDVDSYISNLEQKIAFLNEVAKYADPFGKAMNDYHQAYIAKKSEIEKLQKENARLREALKPFSNAWEYTQRDRIKYSGRSGDYPIPEDYILDAHFKYAQLVIEEKLDEVKS